MQAKTRLVFDNRKKDRVSFPQSKLKPIHETNRKIHPNISYHHYGKKGHYRSHFPAKEEEKEECEETQLLHVLDDT